jgi:hypothetical protein
MNISGSIGDSHPDLEEEVGRAPGGALRSTSSIELPYPELIQLNLFPTD